MRPEFGPWVIRHRGELRGGGAGRHGRVVPLDAREPAAAARAEQRGRDRNACSPRSRSSARSSTPSSAARYWRLFRHSRTLLSASVIACFLLLVRGDDRRRGHGRAQVARELVGVARADRARVPDHRVRRPPRVARGALPGTSTCPTTRERRQDVSVLFGDLVGLHELLRAVVAGRGRGGARTRTGARRRRCSRGGSAARSRSSSATAIVATFNSRGDQPDHALRASRAALALQQRGCRLSPSEHPGWPRLRVGVNSGEAVRPRGRRRRVTSRTRWSATRSTPARAWRGSLPPGGVLIGATTHARAARRRRSWRERTGLRMKGKEELMSAYELAALFPRAVPQRRQSSRNEIGCAPSQSVSRPSSFSCSWPSTRVAKWFAQRCPALLANEQ